MIFSASIKSLGVSGSPIKISPLAEITRAASLEDGQPISACALLVTGSSVPLEAAHSVSTWLAVKLVRIEVSLASSYPQDSRDRYTTMVTEGVSNCVLLSLLLPTHRVSNPASVELSGDLLSPSFPSFPDINSLQTISWGDGGRITSHLTQQKLTNISL